MSENIGNSSSSKKQDLLNCHINFEFFNKNPNLVKPFRITIDRMMNHSYYSEYQVDYLNKSYELLEAKYREKIPFSPKEKIKKVKSGIQINESFFKKITELYIPKFDSIKIPPEEYEKYYGTDFLEIGDYFFNSLLRDWTDEFKSERERNYGKVLEELKKYFNYDDEKLEKKKIKILVPGTGCSRMAFEVAKKGFSMELNDLSFLYTLCCDYLFNHSYKYQFEFCPRIYSFAHSFTEASAVKKYKFPNVDIRKELENSEVEPINFFIGDFIKSYKGKNNLFNCIITIFFIDTASNIMELVEIMYNLLKKGGIWINLGTLDYYLWESCDSIDLTWDELRKVMINTGFDIKNEETGFTPYGVKEGETISYTHGTVFFTAMKN